MERVCIFCGGKPEGKSLEHVLPQWLIELTGNPKRMAYFGFKKSGKEGVAKRRFAFDAFRFPSCRGCNEKFSKLEADTKLVVEKMMSGDCVSESELSALLDWFDKVRIGLWLGWLYLDRNPSGISPHFYVEHRIRQHDRMLAVFRADEGAKGLTAGGCDTPAFAQLPSCFCLRINHLWFFNMSCPNLLARRLGFPFPRESYTMEDGRLYCSFVEGRNRVMRPVLKKPMGIEGTELYQPIFSGNLACADNETVKRLYDTKYVHDNCISWEGGIGRIYIKRDSEVDAYESLPSVEWLPRRVHDSRELSFAVPWATLEWQLYLIDTVVEPSVKLLSGKRRREMTRLIHLNRYYNRRMIELLKRMKR
jgi:hypothetical protein